MKNHTGGSLTISKFGLKEETNIQTKINKKKTRKIDRMIQNSESCIRLVFLIPNGLRESLFM